MDKELVVIVNNLGKSYGSTCIFYDISFSLAQGESLLVIGPNGSGKTTLLSIVAGLEDPDEGRVIVFGKDLSGLERAARAKLRAQKIGFALQEPVLLNRLSALDNVALSAVIAGVEPHQAREIAKELLGRLGLENKANEKAGKLSGGERKRVEIARALAKKPLLLILDEPHSMLDSDSIRLVEGLVKEYLERGGALITSSPRDKGLDLKWNKKLELKGYCRTK